MHFSNMRTFKPTSTKKIHTIRCMVNWKLKPMIQPQIITPHKTTRPEQKNFDSDPC